MADAEEKATDLRAAVMTRLIVITACMSVIVITDLPRVSATSDHTRRSMVGSWELDHPAPSDEPNVVMTSGCADYDTEQNGGTSGHFHIRELLEEADNDHVTVTTHYGQLRGNRLSGISAAGNDAFTLYTL